MGDRQNEQEEISKLRVGGLCCLNLRAGGHGEGSGSRCMHRCEHMPSFLFSGLVITRTVFFCVLCVELLCFLPLPHCPTTVARACALVRAGHVALRVRTRASGARRLILACCRLRFLNPLDAILAPAPPALVLAEDRPAVVPALAPPALVLADVPPPAGSVRAGARRCSPRRIPCTGSSCAGARRRLTLAFLALVLLPLVLADASPAAILALAPLALVLQEATLFGGGCVLGFGFAFCLRGAGSGNRAANLPAPTDG